MEKMKETSFVQFSLSVLKEREGRLEGEAQLYRKNPEVLFFVAQFSLLKEGKREENMRERRKEN